jgi:hypothetical protein
MSDTVHRRLGKTFREMVEETRCHVKTLTPDEAKRIIDGGGAIVIDIGELWQIAERGTIPGGSDSGSSRPEED